MRYQNWDVLLFPDMSKIPLQEFKTSCSVVQDPEAHTMQINSHLLPTVTSFIPGLPPGTSFRCSIHCWQNPEPSRYVQGLKKDSDDIVFEARLFIDGRIAGSKWFNQTGPWPTIMDLSIDLDKHGEFEKLKFPTFHRELLSQSYWNPGDDLGRVKVIIAEGFSRENLTYPFERVKNIVSFSFQHAPLDVLEASSIAWPNAAMWRHVSLVGPYVAQAFSPQRGLEPIEHGHSPRRASTLTRPAFQAPKIGSMLPPAVPIFPRQTNYDPFTEPVHAAFRGWRQSSTDTSMPDYSDPSSRANSTRNISDPMQISQMLTHSKSYDALIDAFNPSAPVNTPQNEVASPAVDIAVPNPPTRSGSPYPVSMKVDDETLLNPTLLMKPIDGVSSKAETITNNLTNKKENVSDSQADSSIRIISNPIPAALNNGAKRQRIVTPAAAKVIDDEDEPRASPSIRKTSVGSMKQEGNGKENERLVLGGIENVNV